MTQSHLCQTMAFTMLVFVLLCNSTAWANGNMFLDPSNDSRNTSIDLGGDNGFQSSGYQVEPPIPTGDIKDFGIEFAACSVGYESPGSDFSNNFPSIIKTTIYSNPSCRGVFLGELKTCVKTNIDTGCFALDEPNMSFSSIQNI